jgi:hypothetical protein
LQDFGTAAWDCYGAAVQVILLYAAGSILYKELLAGFDKFQPMPAWQDCCSSWLQQQHQGQLLVLVVIQHSRTGGTAYRLL